MYGDLSMARTSAPATRRRLGSIAQGADRADVSSRTIRRWISQGLLTGYRVGPRLVKVDLNEVDAIARPIPTAAQAQAGQ